MRALRSPRTKRITGDAPSARRAAPSHDEESGLSAELAALPSLSRDALKARWKELYGAPPPSHLGRPVMIRAIAYRIQEQIYGGLDSATLRRLDRAAQDLARSREPSGAPAAMQPGTRLFREWHGVMHEVIVLEHGVQLREKTWPSLSAVAREITARAGRARASSDSPEASAMAAERPFRRCAVYTRKSSEEGLEL